MDQQRVLAWHHFDNAAHNALAPHPFRSDGEKGHGVAAGSGAVQTTHQPADPRGEAEAIARQHTFLILLPLGQIAAGLWEPWATELARLAALPNVWCKLSGLVTEADHVNWQPADLQPYIDHALATFGAERLMFGGDWPVSELATTYVGWWETAV